MFDNLKRFSSRNSFFFWDLLFCGQCLGTIGLVHYYKISPKCLYIWDADVAVYIERFLPFLHLIRALPFPGSACTTGLTGPVGNSVWPLGLACLCTRTERNWIIYGGCVRASAFRYRIMDDRLLGFGGEPLEVGARFTIGGPTLGAGRWCIGNVCTLGGGRGGVGGTPK